MSLLLFCLSAYEPKKKNLSNRAKSSVIRRNLSSSKVTITLIMRRLVKKSLILMMNYNLVFLILGHGAT